MSDTNKNQKPQGEVEKEKTEQTLYIIGGVIVGILVITVLGTYAYAYYSPIISDIDKNKGELTEGGMFNAGD